MSSESALTRPAMVSACSHSRTYQASSPVALASRAAVWGPPSVKALNRPSFTPRYTLITCMVPTPSMNRRPTSSSTGLVSVISTVGVTTAIRHPSLVGGTDARPHLEGVTTGVALSFFNCRVIFRTAASDIPRNWVLGPVCAEAPGGDRRPQVAGEGGVYFGDGL